MFEVIIVLVLFFIFFKIEIKNAGNCCGDCINYKICHGEVYNFSNSEYPACKNFKEKTQGGKEWKK